MEPKFITITTIDGIQHVIDKHGIISVYDDLGKYVTLSVGIMGNPPYVKYYHINDGLENVKQLISK